MVACSVIVFFCFFFIFSVISYFSPPLRSFAYLFAAWSLQLHQRMHRVTPSGPSLPSDFNPTFDRKFAPPSVAPIDGVLALRLKTHTHTWCFLSSFLLKQRRRFCGSCSYYDDYRLLFLPVYFRIALTT